MTGRENDEPLTIAAYAILNEAGDQARNVGQHAPRPPRAGLATLIYPAKDRATALREARAGIEEKYEWGRGFLPPATTLAEKAASICLHYGTAEQITESILAQPWFPYATQLMVQTELCYASYAQRADALELFTREVAPALGWARSAHAVPPG
jgi:hypothetical protein